jgi:hypothetical protein
MSFRTDYRTIRENNPGKHPARMGEAWGDDEVLQLLQLIQKKKTDLEISAELQRTPGGIKSKRRDMAADYHFNNGYSIEMISKYTGLDEVDIKLSIERRERAQEDRAKRKELLKRLNAKGPQPAQADTAELSGEAKLHARIDTLEAMLKDVQSKLDTLLATAASPPTEAAAPPPA